MGCLRASDATGLNGSSPSVIGQASSTSGPLLLTGLSGARPYWWQDPVLKHSTK